MELSNEEIVDRIKSSKDKKEQMDYLAELYQNNYYYIRKICKKYSGYEELDDLMQEAFFGVRIAVERYDPEQEIPFITYASYWIKQIVTRYIENCGSVVRLPVWVRDKINKYEKMKKLFLQENGREPSDRELADILSWTIAQLKRVKERAIILREKSLDTVICEDDDSFTLKDFLFDPEDHYEELTDQMDDDIKKQDIWDAVDRLDGKKPQILRKRFQEGKTYGQIGEELKITAERVRQLQNKALSRLSRSSKLKIYRDDYILSHAYHGSGAKSFHHTGTSSTERVALDLYSHNINEKMRTAEAKVREISRVKHTSLGEAFTMYLQEKYADLLEEVNP